MEVWQPLAKLAEAVRSREVSATDLVQKALANIKQQHEFQAVIATMEKQTGSDLNRQLLQLGQQTLRQLFHGGYIHGDPHPGNVVLMSGDRVGLIDFGIIAKPMANRLALYEYMKVQIRMKEGEVNIPDLIISIMRYHANYLYRAISSLAELYDRPLFKELKIFLSTESDKFVGDFTKDRLAAGLHTEVMSQGINKGNRFAMFPKLDSPLTQKATSTMWRTNDELGFGELNLQIFKLAIDDVDHTQNVHVWREKRMPVPQAFQIVSEWLGVIAERDPQLFSRIRNVFKRPKIIS